MNGKLKDTTHITMATNDAVIPMNMRKCFSSSTVFPESANINSIFRINVDRKMGIVYSFCFGDVSSVNRANDYKIDDTDEKKTYSWDKRDKVDPKNFMFDGLKDRIIGKLPLEINGQQFIIQNCQNCNIYLFDHTATVTIDDCVDCKIFVGPCRGSVFVRDCSNVKLAVICQQFRTRDCKNVDTYLFCQTQPIIESSSQMRFACLQLMYPKLEELFDQSSLSIFNNIWSRIHDFTPVSGAEFANFSYITQNEENEIFEPLKQLDENSFPDVHLDSEKSLIPLTFGKTKPPSKQICFVLTFSENTQKETSAKFRCQTLIREILKSAQPVEDYCLVGSTELKLQPTDAERITGSKNFTDFANNGTVVAFEFSGPNVSKIPALIEQQSFSKFVHVATEDNAKHQMKIFYNFADMQMSV